MKIHNLKTWPEYFQAIKDGTKTFEVRKNDRNFIVGDLLMLEEYDPSEGGYTGDSVLVKVVYGLEGPAFGISAGYCVMGIKKEPGE